MKPKAVLKRTAITRAIPRKAPLTEPRNSQWHKRGLSLVPRLEEANRANPGAVAYTNAFPHSWFRKYDTSGKLIEEGLCLVEGVPLFRWIYSYSAMGSRAQAVLLNASHCLLEKRLYDETENLTRRIIFAGDGTKEEMDYECDRQRIGQFVAAASEPPAA